MDYMRKMRGDLWGGLVVRKGLEWALDYSLPHQNLLQRKLRWKVGCFEVRGLLVFVLVVVVLFALCVPLKGGAGRVLLVKTLWIRKKFNIR
jgi:hypothetical protein